jgi:hypothetical protein
MSVPGGAYSAFYISESGTPIECESVTECLERVRGAA